MKAIPPGAVHAMFLPSLAICLWLLGSCLRCGARAGACAVLRRARGPAGETCSVREVAFLPPIAPVWVVGCIVLAQDFRNGTPNRGASSIKAGVEFTAFYPSSCSLSCSHLICQGLPQSCCATKRCCTCTLWDTEQQVIPTFQVCSVGFSSEKRN